MSKTIRKAVRCYVIKENKVLITKYKSGNKKEGYYDIPGGKIEEGETTEQAAIREMKEETGVIVKQLHHKGIMQIEYPDRIYDFEVFFSKEIEGEPQEFKENTSEWIEIEELLRQEKILACIMLLDRFFIPALVEEKGRFTLYIQVDEQEKIEKVEYKVEKLC